MKIWILVAIAVALLFWSVSREGFAETPTIKPAPYDAAEKTRIFKMLTKADQDVLVNEVKTQGGDDDEERNILNAKAFLEMVVGRFYNVKYTSATQPITIEVVKAFVADQLAKRGGGGAVIMPNTAGAYERALKAYFVDQQTTTTGDVTPGAVGHIDGVASASYATTQGTTAGGTTGGSSTTSAAPNAGPATTTTKGQLVYGPTFTSMGEPVNGGNPGKDTSKTNQYPELFGGRGDCTSVRTAAGIQGPSQNWLLSQSGALPSTASLGSDENCKYVPFSRTPGDQDLIPDPYRLSRNYSSSSYSNKTDPVPFLTDFSAFQK
jgi:hypothetical protein